MLTRMARRYRGSLPALVSSTASMPSAAAERKIAPRFVGFITFSSTRHARRAPQHRRRVRQRRPPHGAEHPAREMKAREVVSAHPPPPHRPARPGQRASSAAPLPVTCFVSIRNDTGSHPASSARPMTSGLSATNRAFCRVGPVEQLVFRQAGIHVQLRRVKVGDPAQIHNFFFLLSVFFGSIIALTSAGRNFIIAGQKRRK